ncbi:hypothetical protein QR680_003190 [Steinernema hermaphroditum]|uniref:aECM cysteine-cradle domain-containing protein n=1 Tax=Steinernema hermaphroditum TaxID=289476 RepID=A0AA39LJU1_9BILA|nr:hypothetical protein QR680_003190 [Steinernema hermaphroditum]
MVSSRYLALVFLALLAIAHGQESLKEKEKPKEEEHKEVPLPISNRYIDVKKIIKNTIDMMKTYSSPENLAMIPLPQQNQTPVQVAQNPQAPVQISAQQAYTAQPYNSYPTQTTLAQLEANQYQQQTQQAIASWFAPPSEQDMKKLFHLPADIISRLASDAGYIEKEATTPAPSNNNYNLGGFNFNLQSSNKPTQPTTPPHSSSGFVQGNEEEVSAEKIQTQQPNLNGVYPAGVQYIPVIQNGQVLLQPVQFNPAALQEAVKAQQQQQQQQQQQSSVAPAPLSQPQPQAQQQQQQQNSPLGAISQFAVATNQVPGLAALNKEPNQPPVPIMRTITSMAQAPTLQQPVPAAAPQTQQEVPHIKAEQLAALQETLAKLQRTQAQLVQPQIVRPVQLPQQPYQAAYGQQYVQQATPIHMYALLNQPQYQQQVQQAQHTEEMPKPQNFDVYRQAQSDVAKPEPVPVQPQVYSTQNAQSQQYYGHFHEVPQMVNPTTTQQPPLKFENGQEIIIGGQKYILNKADSHSTSQEQQTNQVPNSRNNLPGHIARHLSGIPFIPAVPSEATTGYTTPTVVTPRPLVQKTIVPETKQFTFETTKTLPYQKQYTLKELEDFYNVPVYDKTEKDMSAYPKHKQVKINFQPRVDSITDGVSQTTIADVSTTLSEVDLRNERIANLRRQFHEEKAKKTRKLQHREKEIVPAPPQPIEISEHQCRNIMSFAHNQGEENMHKYALENCAYLNNYIKQINCDNAVDYVDACFARFLKKRV